MVDCISRTGAEASGPQTRKRTSREWRRRRARGFDAVCSVRFSAVDIGGNASGAGKKAMPMAVCTVSGTAYRRLPVAR